MNQVRLLVGTRKGAFILSSQDRIQWDISEPIFAGLEVYHIKGSVVDTNRIYAAPGTAWFGQLLHRSDDGGATWSDTSNDFQYSGVVQTHQWYDGTPHPWEFKRVWHLEPSPTDKNVVYAGVEDAALFRSDDAGASWQELSGLRLHTTGNTWSPGAGGLCLHTILIDPNNPLRIFVAISAAGAFRSLDGGASWTPINRGLVSGHIPDPDAEVGHCVHHLAMHPSQPDVLFMQKHWDVMRSDNGGDSWYEISGDLPSDFGFVIEIDSQKPNTVFVIPIESDSKHYPPEGKLRVYRSQGGNQWHALEHGLPQENCYINVLRDAMSVDQHNPCGIYFGTTGGTVYGSSDGGETWQAIVQNLPSILSVEAQTL